MEIILTRDSLEWIVKLRQMTIDEAREVLGRCIRAEEGIACRLTTLEATIAAETERAADSAVTNVTVDAFAAWFRQKLLELDAVRVTHHDSLAATVRARAELAAAHASLENARSLNGQRAVQLRAERERRFQAQLEDARRGRRRRSEPRHWPE